MIDLFAGTGALTWEALSRGAVSATLIERHFPTARLLRENARQLGVTDQISVVPGDTFVWARTALTSGRTGSIDPDLAWLVFCSPPYEFFVSRHEDMLALIQTMLELAPPHSLLVVESDHRFDASLLPRGLTWDVRHYAPAVLAVGQLSGNVRA